MIEIVFHEYRVVFSGGGSAVEEARHRSRQRLGRCPVTLVYHREGKAVVSCENGRCPPRSQRGKTADNANMIVGLRAKQCLSISFGDHCCILSA